MARQSVDPVAGGDSQSFDAFQGSSNINSRSNVDFSSVDAFQDSVNSNFGSNAGFCDRWLDECHDACFSSELQDNLQTEWTSSWDNEWDYMFQEKAHPKKKRKRKNTKRKLYTDKGGSSTVNGATDLSGALSEALSAISADLSLSSSATSSSHGSPKYINPDSPEKGVPQHEALTYVASREGSMCADSLLFLQEGRFQPDSLEERNGNVLASGSNGNEMPIASTLDAREELKNVNFSVPVVGMEFCSEEEAYNFYKRYAEETGFRVRKGKVQRSSNKEIRKRYFFCSKEGFRLKKQSNKKTKYTRKETRTGCNAKMECTVENGKWVVSQFSQEHNHILGDQINLESQTGMPEAPLVIHSNNGAEMEKDAEATKFVNSCSMDCITPVRGEKAGSLRPEDAQNLIYYFRYLQAEDPSFFHSFQLDADCRMKNIFWREGRAKIDYGYFGDVIILDTTFKPDKYDIKCAPFWGINHHRQFVLFGCAFLLDESTDSLIWLLETFMEAMGRNQPKTIITDESRAMADAVMLKLPEAQHQIGLWYIRKNAAKHLSTYFEQPGFKRLFNQYISNCETEEEYESTWSSLLEIFNLQGNEWLNNLHTSRNKWCHIFSRNTFSAGIQCNDSTESIFQNLTGQDDSVCLSILVKQYFRAAEQQRKEELHEDRHCHETEPDMIVSFCPAGVTEKQAANAYTCTMFEVFQKQLPTLFLVHKHGVTNDGKIARYSLSQVGKKEEFLVEFNCLDSTVACSCKKYESDGILCVHTLKILNERKIFEIPPQYILKRWTKSAKDDVAAVHHAGTADGPKRRLDVNRQPAAKAEGGAPFSSANRIIQSKEQLACFEESSKEHNTHNTVQEPVVARQLNRQRRAKVQQALGENRRLQKALREKTEEREIVKGSLRPPLPPYKGNLCSLPRHSFSTPTDFPCFSTLKEFVCSNYHDHLDPVNNSI